MICTQCELTDKCEVEINDHQAYLILLAPDGKYQTNGCLLPHMVSPLASRWLEDKHQQSSK